MSTPTGRSDSLRRVIVLGRRLYWPLVLACLAYAAYHASDLLPPVVANARPGQLLGACLLWLALHLLSPAFSWLLLREAGTAITYGQMLRIHVSRLPARYLPGGIWHTVSRMADLHRMGFDRASLSRLVVMENTIPVGAAAIIGGTCIAATGAPGIGIPAMAVGAAMLVVVPLVLRYRHLGGVQPVALPTYVPALFVMTLFWSVAGLAFTCYWSAYPATAGDASMTRIAGTYLLAWAAGFVSVFAPQGAGVFEVVAGMLLKGALPLAGTALVVAGFRLVILVADLAAFATLQSLLLLRGKASGH